MKIDARNGVMKYSDLLKLTDKLGEEITITFSGIVSGVEHKIVSWMSETVTITITNCELAQTIELKVERDENI